MSAWLTALGMQIIPGTRRGRRKLANIEWGRKKKERRRKTTLWCYKALHIKHGINLWRQGTYFDLHINNSRVFKDSFEHLPEFARAVYISFNRIDSIFRPVCPTPYLWGKKVCRKYDFIEVASLTFLRPKLWHGIGNWDSVWHINTVVDLYKQLAPLPVWVTDHFLKQGCITMSSVCLQTTRKATLPICSCYSSEVECFKLWQLKWHSLVYLLCFISL